MTHKIKKIAQKTQNILKLAACIGNQFSLEALSIVNNTSQHITAQQLQLALDKGLVIPLDNNYKLALLWDSKELSRQLLETETLGGYSNCVSYKFLHDRVQQAVYSLIPEEEKKRTHLQIGRLLLKNITDDELLNNIFEIVNQLNEGSELITEQQEKDNLAELNLKAAKKAKASTAYETALKYLDSGLSLLTTNSWSEQYQLTLELHEEKLHSLFLNTEFQQILFYSNIIINQAKSILDKVKTYQIKIEFYYANFQPDQAIDTALKTLKELGILIYRRNGKSNINQRDI